MQVAGDTDIILALRGDGYISRQIQMDNCSITGKWEKYNVHAIWVKCSGFESGILRFEFHL